MYAVGENFEYLINEEEKDIFVIGDIMMFGSEYLICEDQDGDRYAFVYNENEEMVELIDDNDESSEILEDWEKEYYGGGTDIGDWEGDSYYEREDMITTGSEDVEAYFEGDEDQEETEDVDSFISALMGG